MFILSKRKNRESNFKPLLFLSVLIISIVFITPGCSKDNTPTNPGNQGTNEVLIESNDFSPQNKTISFGDAVKWINKDVNNHRVVSGVPGSPDGRFDSGILRTGDEFSFTFDNRTGTFEYFDSIHPSVTGIITVQ